MSSLKLEALCLELDEIVRKSDYRNDEKMGLEGDAWKRALSRVYGPQMPAEGAAMAENKKLNLSVEELDFLNLILMVGNTASVELGVKAPKGAAAVPQNLPRARQFINMLVALEKKTEGRRSPQEDEVLKKLLEDLQEKYVKAAGLEQPESELGQIGHIAAQAYARSRKPQN